MEEFKDSKLVERKLVVKDYNTTPKSQTSIGSDTSLKEFIEELKEAQQTNSPGLKPLNHDRSVVKNWSVDIVIQWLEFISMIQYANIFVENRIDGVCLLSIKEKDLLNMGITSKGHRMSIREGIEKLRKLSQPQKQKKITIHSGYSKKKQAFSLTSELKLREYYKTVKIIDEEESDGSSKSGSKSTSNKIKSTSAKFLGNSSKSVFSSSSEETRKDQKKKNSIDLSRFDMQPIMMRTNSTQAQQFFKDGQQENLKSSSYMRKPNTPRTPDRGKFTIDLKDPMVTIAPLDASKNRTRTLSGSKVFSADGVELNLDTLGEIKEEKTDISADQKHETPAYDSLRATGSSKSSSSSSSSSSSVN